MNRLFALPVPAGSLAGAITLAITLAFASPGLRAASPEAAKYYEDALKRYEAKDLPGTIIQLLNAMKADPQMLAARVLYAHALLDGGNASSARNAAREALRLGVNRDEVVLLLARTTMLLGEQPKLLTQPEFKHQDLPPAQRFELLIIKAQAAQDGGDRAAAQAFLDEARAIDPRSPLPLLAQSQLELRTGRPAEALAAADAAGKLAPKAADVEFHRGNALEAMNKLPAALGAYARAIELDAKHVPARFARANALLAANRHAEARKDITELQTLADEDPRSAFLAANLAHRDGKLEAVDPALRAVTKRLDAQPLPVLRATPQLLLINGMAHLGLGEDSIAAQYLQAYRQLVGGALVTRLLAQTYLRQNELQRALETLEPYVRAQPGDAPAAALLGRILIASKRAPQAVSLLQKSLALGESSELRAVLGLAHLRAGQANDAVRELEAALQRDPGQTAAALALADLYQRANLHDKALALAQAQLKAYPRRPEVINLMGEIQLRRGNLQAARSAFTDSLKVDPNQPATRLNLARVDVRAHAYPQAEKALLDLIQGLSIGAAPAAPASGATTGAAQADNQLTLLVERSRAATLEVQLELAALYERMGRGREAREWYERTVERSPSGDRRAALALVDFNLRAGRAAAALEQARKLANTTEPDISVLMPLAKAQLANADPAGARATLTNASRLASFDPALLGAIASLQLEAGDVAGAAYAIEKALADNPQALGLQSLMVDVEIKRGNLAAAEKRARDIIKAQPKLATGHTLLGQVALAAKNLDAATEAYGRALQLEPNTETVLRLFGAVTLRYGGPAALPMLERWVRDFPKDWLARNALSEAYVRLGNFPAAESSYQAQIKLIPPTAAVLNNLASVMLRTGNPQAITVAEQALAADPTSAEIQATAGWAAFKAGKNERALQLLRDAKLRDPKSAELRYFLGAALARAGRNGEALAELQAALALGKPFREQAEAQALLATLQAAR